jgi:hypothetical protein
MSLEIDEIKFQNLLREKQHKQIIDMMAKILKEIGETKPMFIDRVQADIDFEKLKKVFTFENSNNDIPMAIKNIGDTIIKKIESLNKPNSWKFLVNRNNDGYIVSVDANSK